MHWFVKVFLAVLLPSLLTILSIYWTVYNNKFHLPLYYFSETLAIILPYLNAGLLYTTTRPPSQKISRSRLHGNFPTDLNSIIFTSLFILDTILVTLASASLSPQTLTCNIQRRWQALFSADNAKSIRGIQDALDCCGFRSVKDLAWPFPAKGVDAGTCARRFGRTRACEGLWTSEGRKVLGLMIGVGTTLFVAKVLFLALMRLRPEWFGGEVRGDGHVVRGRIMGEDAEESERLERGRYLDEPEPHANGAGESERDGQGRVLASG